MIKTITLLPGITLRCFPEKRFKRGYLSLQWIRPMDREENALNGLLPAVLARGTEHYPDLRAITIRLDDLYGAAVGGIVRQIGDYHAIGMGFGFVEDRFALGEDKILEPVLEFAGEILLNPRLEQGVFAPDVVESEKKNMIAGIEALYNNKRQYADVRLLQTMCREDPRGIPRLGTPEQVARITPEALYAHYKKVLQTSPVEVFYVGAAEPEKIAQMLKKVLSGIPRQPEALPAQTGFRDGGASRETEEVDVVQGRLGMGFVTPITRSDPRYAAMCVCNAVLGASMISKLFMVIREKLSLCYDIDSEYMSTKGLLMVTAGIDCGKFDQVRQQVLVQLDSCKAGDITQTELSAAKERMISGLKRVHDSASMMEGYYTIGVLTGQIEDPETAIEKIRRVTREDVAAAAQTLQLHTEYFLKGVQ